MKASKNSILSGVTLLLILLMVISCGGMKNLDRIILKDNEEGSFRTVRDGTKILLYGHSMPCPVALEVAKNCLKLMV